VVLLGVAILLAGWAGWLPWWGERDSPQGIETVADLRLVVRGGDTPIAAGDDAPNPSNLTDFGQALLDTASPTAVFTLRNVGDTTLHIELIDIDGAFAIASPPIESILP